MNEKEVARVVEAVLESLPDKPVMTLELAKALIEKTEARAKELGMAVVIAVSDAAARPVAVHCMDGAYIGSYDIALNKTFTSVGFRMSTAELGELSRPDGPLYGIQHTNEGKVVIFGGGELLEAQGTVIGAVGVSGGTAQQDTSLAEYARNVFPQILAEKQKEVRRGSK